VAAPKKLIYDLKKGEIMKRKKMSKNSSKRLFAKTAGTAHAHPKNFRPNPMRGGYRL